MAIDRQHFYKFFNCSKKPTKCRSIDNCQYRQHLRQEIIRRKRAAWAAYNTIKSAVSHMKNLKIKAELFSITVISAHCYGPEH